MRRLAATLLAVFAVAVSARAAPTADQYLAHIRQWEGVRSRPYSLNGIRHVGIGHSLTAHGERAKPFYTHAEIMALFYRDLAAALEAARAGVHDFDGLPDEGQILLVSLAFNTGTTGFARFSSFRAAMGARDYQSAARELARSHWRKQVGAARTAAYVRTLVQLQLRAGTQITSPSTP